MPYRYYISWVGSYAQRVLKGIMQNPDKRTPDSFLFLLEAKNDQWKEYQNECLENITANFGIFKDRIKRKEMIMSASEKAGFELIFKDLYDEIINIRKLNDDAEFIIDITAAPKEVSFILALLASTLSNEKSEIVLGYTPKKAIPDDPGYYAPQDSRYYEKHVKGRKELDIPLSEYRQREKYDEGGEFKRIPVLTAYYEILDPYSKNLFLHTIFHLIPPSAKDYKSTDAILKELQKNYPKILAKEFDVSPDEVKNIERPGRKKSVEGKKDKRDIASKIRASISANLNQFKKNKLIEVNKDRKTHEVRKTWGGDLISSVTEDLFRKMNLET